MAPVPVQGLYNVKQLLSSLLSEEYAAQSILPYGNQILISAPGNLPILEQFFIHNLPIYRNLDKILVKHMTPLVKSPFNTLSPLINLDILSSIFPFAISQALHYEVYSFYRKELLTDPFHYAFPYFIIFSRAVVLLSPDGCAALPLTEAGTVSYYTDLFHAALKKSMPLITSRSSLSRQEDMLPPREGPIFVIGCRPCLAALHKEELLRGNYYCVFSKEDLSEFALAGACPELSPCPARDLDMDNRRRLLQSLFLACKNDQAFLRLVAPHSLSLPKHITISMNETTGIDFSRYDSSGCQHVCITEPGILEAFEDFYDYICKSNMIVTKEETLKEIEDVIAKSEKNLI